MSNLVVVSYPNEYQAEEVRLRLLRMQKEYLVDLEDAAIAVRKENGKVKLRQLYSLTGATAISGGFWGLLVGLIFLNPLLGAAMGAARTGKKVLLVDRNSTPGGSTVFCGTPVFTPYKSFKDLPKQGIFAEFIEKAGDRCLKNPSNGAYNISEFDTALLMTRLLKDSGVDMLFYAALVGGTFQEGKIRKITLFCCGKNLEFSADHFVDTTGDAVLSVMAGCPVNEPPVDESMTKTVLPVFSCQSFSRQSL